MGLGLTGRTNSTARSEQAFEGAFTPHSHTLSARRIRAPELGFDRHNFNDALQPSARDREPRPGAEPFDETLRRWNESFAPSAEFDVVERKRAAQVQSPHAPNSASQNLQRSCPLMRSSAMQAAARAS